MRIRDRAFQSIQSFIPIRKTIVIRVRLSSNGVHGEEKRQRPNLIHGDTFAAARKPSARIHRMRQTDRGHRGKIVGNRRIRTGVVFLDIRPSVAIRILIRIPPR